jgi:pyruvate/2-oxoglutarate/acetoin dehydrogenase E1 component
MAEMTIAEALRQALREEMRRDRRVFLVGGGYWRAGRVWGGIYSDAGPCGGIRAPAGA